MSKGNRRADGSLRPTVARARARKNGIAVIHPDDAKRFRKCTLWQTRVWNSLTLRTELDLDVSTLGAILEQLAREHHWLKCRDSFGVVRAIGLPTNHPERETVPFEVHHDAMLARVTRSVREMVA